jgi:uncharacterized protein (DUF362 family)
MPLVSIVKCEEDRIDRAVNQAIDLVDGLENIGGRTRITVKPNLCTTKSSDSGATTDLRVVEALIKKIRSITSCSVSIVETNNSKASADRTFDYLGYSSISQRHDNVRCVNLSNDSRVRVDINGEILSSLLVPHLMISSDYIVSIAKLKTHVDYLYTGVLKNQYGFLLRQRGQYHGFMSKVLTDLNKFYRPDLCIVDGLVGMEGFGPTDGRPKHVGVIIASKDPVAADSVAARVIGIDPSKIGYLTYAEKKGVGTTQCEVVGSSIADVATLFSFIPARYYRLSRLSLALQRYSRYMRNCAEFVRLARSALSTVGFSAIESRMSYSGIVKLAADVIFKLE